jgi:hypothetical protein
MEVIITRKHDMDIDQAAKVAQKVFLPFCLHMAEIPATVGLYNSKEKSNGDDQIK